MVLWILDFLLILVGALVSIAFFTLMERKFLGYVHFRKGPTKLFYWGFFQPISDAVKLFVKEFFKGLKVSSFYFFFGPLFGFFLMFFLWSSYSSFFGGFTSFFIFVYVFSFLSMGIYFLLLCGWGSGSKYALLGTYRSVSQTISYEISLIFFGLCLVYLVSSYDFLGFSFFQFSFWFFFLSLFLVFSWFFVCLAESNRTPFDFSEGESELVSGFNVEFSGGFFSLIFICEYGMIIFLSFLSVVFFMGCSDFFFKLLFVCIFFVWVRGCYPRYRYDMLMKSAWEVVLPFSLVFLIFLAVLFFLVF